MSAAFQYVKTGYLIFHAITNPVKSSAVNLSVEEMENAKRQRALLVQNFIEGTPRFIELLDSALHRKPSTTDWAALVTSIALCFDMFQYMYYLLQVSLHRSK